MKKIKIHGFEIRYEDNAKEGIDYLRYDLDKEEAGVFFNQAKSMGYAKFEDDEDRQFTLAYNPEAYNSKGTYTLVRR